jgi:hypothetical protein
MINAIRVRDCDWVWCDRSAPGVLWELDGPFPAKVYADTTHIITSIIDANHDRWDHHLSGYLHVTRATREGACLSSGYANYRDFEEAERRLGIKFIGTAKKRQLLHYPLY